MKKYIIYIGILVIGLLLGSILFGNSSSSSENHDHELTEIKSEQWTCSMHPQILQSEPGTCPICGMDLIPASTSKDGLALNQFKMTTKAMALANIETAVIGKKVNGIGGLVLSGKIRENEKSMTIQTAHFGGRIEKLYINSVGEKVSNGQLLALIYSPELVTAQSELLTALLVKNTQPDLYLAVRNKLKLWKLSENQINKIETSKKLITNFPVYTNVSGIVTMKMVEQGNHVKEGAPLLKIANLNTVWAEFDAYEKQLSAIKKGDEIIITTNANPSKSMISKVSFIDPILNTTTRTVTVRAQLNNKNGNLKPGMFVNGEIKTLNKSSKNDVITIPKTAVLWTGKRSVVYLKIHGEQPVFEMREVTLGNVVGDSYEILNGLLENDEIVVNGTFTVDAAAQLKGKKSMMNKAGGTVMTGHDHGGSQPTTLQPQKENITNTSISITDNSKKALLPLYEEYLVMKDALTQDKFGAAQKSGSSILKILENIDMSIFKGQSHDFWMKQSNIIKNALEQIMHYKKIEEIRNSFQQVSNAMISLTSSFKPFDKLLYVQHCPMADNNKGADWLSLSKEIKNPYFGNAMLSCGEVISTMQ